MSFSARIRFAIWTLAVIGASIGQRVGLGATGVGICLGIIAALLSTSPVDAIRLPRWSSDCLIILGTLMLHGINWRLGIAIVLLILLRLARQSPWWAVLIAWFPAY